MQIRPEVWRIMKAIFSGLMSWAAMIKSPSFSREMSSRTMMKSPLPGCGMLVQKRIWGLLWKTYGRRRLSLLLSRIDPRLLLWTSRKALLLYFLESGEEGRGPSVRPICRIEALGGVASPDGFVPSDDSSIYKRYKENAK